MRFVKPVLLSLLLVLVIVVAALAYLAATFDPRAYAPQLAEIIKERTGRTLTIEGDVDLSFWPDLGIRAEGLALSERESAAPFAKIESLRLSLELRPLLERRFVADEIALRGAHVAIVRYEDGRLNIDDLLGKEEATGIAFDIGRLRIERSTASYRDLEAGTGYEIGAIEIETGRLGEGLSIPAAVAFTVHDHAKTIQLALAAHGNATFDLAKRHYSFERGRVELKGRSAAIESIAARADGGVRLQPAGATVALASGAVDLRSRVGGGVLEGAIAFQALSWAEGTTRAGGVAARLSATHPAGPIAMALRAPAVEYTQGVLHVSEMAGTVDVRRGEYRLRANVHSPLRGEVPSRQLTLPQLKLGLALTGPRVDPGGASATAAGTASVDFAREAVQLALAGTLDGSRMKLRLSAAGFQSPVYTFAGDIDRLDMQRYTARRAAARDPETGSLDLAPLAALSASGTLRVGELIVGETRARNVTLVLK